jgi:NADH-quinone oxidoreductase subunit J
MLTRHKTGGETNPSNYHRWGALILSVLFVAVMLAAYQGSPLPASICSIHDTVDALADLMLMHYVLAFELAAVLLLAALVGAIVLAKGADEG